ncbi:MAG: L-histidine N(alpha)-methyltransferase [Balneolaceae bacterium]
MDIQEKSAVSATMEEEVMDGLKHSPKTLPSKYFYDKRGSELFEQICELEEYYPTDTEISIMESNIDAISAALGKQIELIELGSGSSTKTRLLLKHLTDIAAYIPVDISRDFLHQQEEKLQKEFPGLAIYPVAADYTQSFTLPVGIHSSRKVVYFPGSTIGNFTPENARYFLCRIAQLIGDNGGLLIGVDTKKSTEVLERAYNDEQGVTAEFNKNLLVRLNREMNAGFDPDQFEHEAIYNEREGRIEMHLVSLCKQEVKIAGETIYFEKGETIHTENSYKYTPEEFAEIASGYFSTEKTWLDDRGYFCIHFLTVSDQK